MENFDHRTRERRTPRCCIDENRFQLLPARLRKRDLHTLAEATWRSFIGHATEQMVDRRFMDAT